MIKKAITAIAVAKIRCLEEDGENIQDGRDTATSVEERLDVCIVLTEFSCTFL